MNPIYFKALLKSTDDHIMDEGRACISRENNCLDYKSEFVPLMKMGMPVKIVQLSYTRQELQCFEGKVYLSSSDLLRVVSVSPDELAEAEERLKTNTSIHAQIASQPERAGGFPLFRRGRKKEDLAGADIYFLANNSMKFTSAGTYQPGQKLILRADTPVMLRKVSLTVSAAAPVDETLTDYLCAIEAVPEPYLTSLTEYVDEIGCVNPRLMPAG